MDSSAAAPTPAQEEAAAEHVLLRPVLPSCVVHVWALADGRSCCSARHLAVLDPGEQARAARFRSEQHRIEYIGAHWLLRTALSHYTSRDPSLWRFAIEPGGRPVLAPEAIPCESDDIYFSLSHAAGGALVAISRGRAVGVDVEGEASLRAMPEFAGRILSVGERTRWAREPDPRVRSQFALSRWTLKEAYGKARGLGLELDFGRFGFDDVGGALLLDPPPPDDTAPDNWWFVSFAPWPAATAALAVSVAPGQTVEWHLRVPPGLDPPDAKSRMR